MRPRDRRHEARARLEVVAEELEEALAGAVDEGDLRQAADLWAASAAVWSAVEHLGSLDNA